jgi:2-polyprenyl-3-methyl-5-hydroxy-6-metoxy-1,4-benzoquinol methylase
MEKSLLNNYEEYYESASFISQQHDKDEVRRFTEIAGTIGANLDILDIGCAEGELAVSLAKKGNRVTAADISKSFLEQTAQRARDNGVKGSTVFFDVEKDAVAFNGKTYDVIFLMDVIEHLLGPAKALANIRTLLRDNGILVIHTPNLSSLALVYRYVRFRARRENYFLPENLGDLHLQGYDYQTLEKALNFSGLQIEKVMSTAITLPLIYRFAWARPFSRALSKLFPLISDTLLVQCRKVTPVDMEKQIVYWKNLYGTNSGKNTDSNPPG